MVVVLEQFGEYPGKPFKAIAAKAWNEFFQIATERVDVAHWFVEAHSGMVRLSARISSADEFGVQWEPLAPVIATVPGVFELLGTEPDQEALCQSFREWVEEGILDAFQSARLAKKYQRFNPDGTAFAIVTAETDEGLCEDELNLLWTSRPRFTVASIKSRQEAARATGKKERKGWKVVKKKRAKVSKKKR